MALRFVTRLSNDAHGMVYCAFVSKANVCGNRELPVVQKGLWGQSSSQEGWQHQQGRQGQR